MSEQHKEPTVSVGDEVAATPTPAEPLTELMAQGAKDAASARPKVDLDRAALAAAEQALAAGQAALAAAQRELTGTAPRATAREWLLRVLLAINVVAMVVVALLPTASGTGTAPVEPTTHGPAVPPSQTTNDPTLPGNGTQAPNAAGPAVADLYNRALLAAERQDWRGAITLLEEHLAAAPRMAPSQRLSVLMALGYYSSRAGDFTAARDYQRKAEAIEQSHSLPEDLVAMAKAAADSGDQEALRRVWARFLLQQKQIPSWLYKHVAEAYLQLGDSYRNEANTAAERQRIADLEALAAKLAPQQNAKGGGK